WYPKRVSRATVGSPGILWFDRYLSDFGFNNFYSSNQGNRWNPDQLLYDFFLLHSRIRVYTGCIVKGGLHE
ncbi:MAG TPA: hypothetical protein PLU76_09450, partial [Treponemataceae bacterium]|nr:hypothetical protein [Treponemataceae bacterium]